MLNRYPLWKYLILIIVTLIGLLYALPNLYNEEEALQITGTHGVVANHKIIDQICIILKNNHIASKSITLKDDVILVRFKDLGVQLHAREALSERLDEKFIIALHLAPTTPRWLTKLGATPIKLGLDLRGGVYFLMQVEMNTVFNKLQEKTIDALHTELYKQRIPYMFIRKTSKNQIEVCFYNDASRDKAIHYVSLHQRGLIISNKGSNTLIIEPSDALLNEEREYAMQQNITILRNRVNQLGITEPLVQRQGINRIVVELPGTQDAAQAKEIIGATATLEFRLVNTNIDIMTAGRHHIPWDSEEKYTRDGRSIVLYKQVILTGNHITHATSSINEYNRPQVNVALDSSGGRSMFMFTKKNIGKPIATLLVEYKDNDKKDNNDHLVLKKIEEVINIAIIQSRLGQHFCITGINNLHEARQLALLLRAGALIAPIQILEERTIGPTLGQKNITQSLKACLWGFLISAIFMIVWYRIFGVIATAALIVNLILIIGILSLLPGATLTMPGIAGILLTLAVAVDSNVLINERIKEELKNGRSIQKAINEGYNGALSSIVDANIVTLIIAAILYFIGTGSIKGFAVSTIIGVMTSMFTAVLGTRSIVNLLYGGKRIKKLSI
ncbi:protein translocase subunit SecD [Candidatus Gillettellia adelgis]